VWNAFNILHDIETAVGNQAAARTAWVQARDAYLAYRRQGGYAQHNTGKLVDRIIGLIAEQKFDELEELFSQLANDPKSSDSRKATVRAMASIFNGSRDPALDYADAVEILFLLARLGG